MVGVAWGGWGGLLVLPFPGRKSGAGPRWAGAPEGRGTSAYLSHSPLPTPQPIHSHTLHLPTPFPSPQERTPTRGSPELLLELSGQDLIGTPVKSPLCPHERVYVLPLLTILTSKGTGVVTSVPSDSPDDYTALQVGWGEEEGRREGGRGGEKGGRGVCKYQPKLKQTHCNRARRRAWPIGGRKGGRGEGNR